MANNNHFDLTLDTTAPQGSISSGVSGTKYANENFNLTINSGNASFMKVWFNKNSIGTKSDPTYPADWSTITTVPTQFSEDGQYYYHLVLLDALGNESEVFNTNTIIYDKSNPVINAIIFGDGMVVTNTRTIPVTVTFTSEPAQASLIYIDGDVSSACKTDWKPEINATEATAGRLTRTITLSGEGEEDTTKTVKFYIKDLAGNQSGTVSNQIILDTKMLRGNIAIYDREEHPQLITGTWVNFRPVEVRLILTDETKQDVVGYKVWGDINVEGQTAPTPEPATFTEVAKGTSPISVYQWLNPGEDGESYNKKIYAKVIDDAGNITELTTVHMYYDTTPPIVSIAFPSSTSSFVSKVEGYNTKTIIPTVNGSRSGCKSYQWNMNGSKYSDGSGDPTNLIANSVNMGEEGQKKFTLTVVDNAGNSTTSDELIVNLDTTPPTCPSGITTDAWYCGETSEATSPYKKWSNFVANASAYDSGAGIDKMECWVSTTPQDTTVPAGVDKISYHENPTYSEIGKSLFQESSSLYLHIRYSDKVGNTSIVHSNMFGVDTIPPHDPSVGFQLSIYRVRSASVNCLCSDATSGVQKVKLWGDIVNGSGQVITEETAEWLPYGSSVSVTLKDNAAIGTQEVKTIYAKFRDLAGNVSDQATASTVFSSSDFATELRLYDKYDITDLTDTGITNEANFHSRVWCSGDNTNLRYQLWGDFSYDAQSSQGEVYDPDPTSTKWKTLVLDEGKTYMTIPNCYFTEGDGKKTIYAQLIDAGNNTAEQSDREIEYDTAPPEVQIMNHDYNTISKNHVLRRNSAGPISGKYCDFVTFILQPSTIITDYKVCAYLTKDAAQSGSHNDPAIKQLGDDETAKSVNMHGSGLRSDNQIICQLNGTDYENALGGPGHDGARYVVAYVKDVAGNWSSSAVFEV